MSGLGEDHWCLNERAFVSTSAGGAGVPNGTPSTWKQRLNRPITFALCPSFWLITACSKSPDQRLVGTWALDVDATMTAMGDELPEGEAETVRGALEGMCMNLTFTADGNATMAMGAREETATYEVDSTGENSVTVAMTEEGDEEADESTINFAGNDSFTMTGRNDTFTFARQQRRPALSSPNAAKPWNPPGLHAFGGWPSVCRAGHTTPRHRRLKNDRARNCTHPHASATCSRGCPSNILVLQAAHRPLG